MGLDRVRAKVNAFLNKQQRATLQRVGIQAMMLEVRLWVPEVKGVSDKDLRSLVVGYFLVHHLLLEAAAPPTGPDDKIKEAVRDAVRAKTRDVDVQRDGKSLKICLTGVTAELTRNWNTTSVKVGPSGTTVKRTEMGGESAAVTLGWDGTLSVALSQDNFYLTTSLSKDKWGVTLSYPSDTPVPDLGKLGQVFGEGERALGEIAGATSGLSDLKEVSKVIDTLKPSLGKVLTAVDAAQGIRKAKRGVNLGLSFGSPDPHPGEDKPMQGIQGAITLTVIF